MRAVVTFEIRLSESPTVTRDSFWRMFANLSSITTSQPSTLEDQFRRKFPPTLTRLINEELNSRTWSRQLLPWKRIRIGLQAIHYGSLEAFLNVLGIDSEDLRDTVVEPLEYYSPIAFDEVFAPYGPVQVDATVTRAEAYTEPKKRQWLWPAYLGTSLLTPVALALAICYVVFKDVSEQQKT
jgi:hypothetical protein